jgi:hypothetical protein
MNWINMSKDVQGGRLVDLSVAVTISSCSRWLRSSGAVVPIGCSVAHSIREVQCCACASSGVGYDGDCMCDAYLHALNGAAGNDDRDREEEA